MSVELLLHCSMPCGGYCQLLVCVCVYKRDREREREIDCELDEAKGGEDEGMDEYGCGYGYNCWVQYPNQKIAHLTLKVDGRGADEVAVVIRLLHRRHGFAAHHRGQATADGLIE